MNTKHYTSIEQSKKLLELGLSPETADMWYQHTGISIKDGSQKPIYFPMVIRDCESDEDIPCWSVGALLDVLPYPSLHKTFTDWRCDSYDKGGKTCKLGENANNPIDACYEMVLKLNELNLL